MIRTQSNLLHPAALGTGMVSMSLLAFRPWAGTGSGREPFNLELTPESLALLLAGLLAVLFDWFPGLASWYGTLSRLKKQQVMIVLLGLVVALVLTGSCQGWYESGLSCSWNSLPEIIQIILAAAGVNQAVHLLTRPT